MAPKTSPARRAAPAAPVGPGSAAFSAPWHFLNFLPLPQGHGSFGPAFISAAGAYKASSRGTRGPAPARGRSAAANSRTPVTGSKNMAENLAARAAPRARPHQTSRRTLGY